MKRFLSCTVAVLTVLSFGLVLIHCGGGGDDEKECETNEDCDEGYWCDRTKWECKKNDCTPNCIGKCCGEDGCGKTCPDNCLDGFECNTNCECQATGCETDANCEATECCIGDPKTCTSMSCGNLQCGPDPVCGKECGPCPAGETCNNGVCETTSCQTDADCNETQCCKTGVCTDMACGNLQCGPDPVCGKDCGSCQGGHHCDQGTCVEDVACTNDDQCAATECCIDDICTAMACGALECGPDPVCGKECGPCPAGHHCDQGTCVQDVTCTNDDDCETTECCIGNPKTCTAMACDALECGPDPVCGKECGPCPAGETCNNGVCETGTVTGDCPAGQECTQVGASGSMGCVIPPDTVPETNQTDCAENGCDGNYACYCLDQQCTESTCIELCGTCPAGLDCCELWPGGPMGCLTANCTDVPANPPQCGANTPCQGNAGCYSDGTNHFCIDNCSVDHGPCQNGETRCSGNTVQTCTNGAWVDTTNCNETQCCITGVCMDMACGALECGPDPVCGKECGPCPAGHHCDQGTCIQDATCTTDDDCADTECCIGDPKTCTPMACGALECGPDPVCGKECGPCPAGEDCDNGVCVASSIELCPAGQECTQVGAAGAMGCVIPPDTVPETNQTDCAENGCNGNYACYCLNQQCTDSICIENCGECPAGLYCCELWPGGPNGCLANAGCTDVPANPPQCDVNTPCQGNAGCYSDGTNHFCIDNCSVDHSPCQNGETRCYGNTVQTCTNGAWEDTTDCTTNNQVCIDGACVTPAGLGEFCEDSVCEEGMDCIGTDTSEHRFCTPKCDCENHTGCDADWECLFEYEDPVDPTCWCAKLCITADDCPDAGAGGFTCVVLGNDGTNEIYGCMIQ